MLCSAWLLWVCAAVLQKACGIPRLALFEVSWLWVAALAGWVCGCAAAGVRVMCSGSGLLAPDVEFTAGVEAGSGWAFAVTWRCCIVMSIKCDVGKLVATNMKTKENNNKEPDYLPL